MLEWPYPLLYSDCQWLGLNLLWGVTLLVHLDSFFLPSRTETRQIWQSLYLCWKSSSPHFEQHTRPEFCKWLWTEFANCCMTHLIRPRLVDLPCFQFSHLVNNADHHGSLNEALQWDGPPKRKAPVSSLPLGVPPQWRWRPLVPDF